MKLKNITINEDKVLGSIFGMLILIFGIINLFEGELEQGFILLILANIFINQQIIKEDLKGKKK